MNLKKTAMLSIAFSATFSSAYADITCRGRVIDARDKQSLYCALIHVPDMKYKSTTDRDGYFSITVPQGIPLDVAYVGYETTTIFARKDLGTIELQESNLHRDIPQREKPSIEEIASWIDEAYRLDDEDKCVSAAILFKMAAQEDYVPGQYGLGLCYLTGRGVDKDLEKGSKYVFFAAQEGYTDAEYTMGILFRDGLGMPRNINMAKEWLGKAAAKGHKKAIDELEKLK